MGIKQVFSLSVWECVNHPPVFMHVLIIVVDLQKFHQIPTKSQSSVHCCAVPSKRQKKGSSTPCIGRTGEVWENNLRSLSRLLLMASTSSSSQLCLSGGWTGLYSLHKKMCAADFTSNILSLLPQSFLFFHATQRMFCCLKYFFTARPKALSRQQNWRACSTR